MRGAVRWPMRSRPTHARWLRLTPLVLFACQRPPDISAELDEYTSLLSDANDLACNCPEDLGYATTTECREVLSPVDANEYECLVQVLDGHEDEAKAYLDCANAAYRGYADCLAENVDCTEGWYDGCTADHEGAMASCTQLPATVESAVTACTG